MEQTTRAISDFNAGSQAGAAREQERWMLMLQAEKLDVEEALEEADETGEIEVHPLYLAGWRDCLEYLLNPSQPIEIVLEFGEDDEDSEY
jgi:hypothetical protein